jgi:manganese/zinc/iron transport system permease protein
MVVTDDKGDTRLTEEGFHHAARITRNHRLWEMYLVTHADIAPSHVDRDAEEVEHVLGTEMVQRLEELLERRGPVAEVPPSPHLIPATVSDLPPGPDEAAWSARESGR